MDGNDTAILGSGTKGFTAAAVLRLVDQGHVKLEDAAYLHIDEPMKRMWNTSMVEIFGARAANVTVHDLIYMRSGIADFETLLGDFDKKYLFDTPNQTHSPLETFQFVGN